MTTPEAPAELLAFLRSLGATDDRISEYHADHRLSSLAGDLVLSEGLTLTMEEAARIAGCGADEVAEIYRVLGITGAELQPGLGAADVELLRTLFSHRGELPQGSDLLRVIATSIARVADAVVAAYVQQVEVGLDANRTDALERAEVNAAYMRLALAAGGSLGTVFRHHLRQAIRRQRASQVGVAERAVGRFAVGFVDLVGFTPMARELTPGQLVTVLSDFERDAFDIAAGAGGSVVKHIGDEIMFIALDADAAGRIALRLVERFTGDVEPRGGLSFGEVVMLHGDYYGPVVNLASRLVDHAVPGEVLLDEATAAQVAALGTEPAGRRQLKGFDAPVRTYALARTSTP